MAKIEFEVYRNNFFAALEAVIRDNQNLDHPKATSDRVGIMNEVRSKMNEANNPHVNGLRRAHLQDISVHEAAVEYFDAAILPTAVPQVMTLEQLLTMIEANHHPVH